MKAVVDRIENNLAVVLFEDRKLEINIPMELLPQNTKEGIWLNIDISIDQEKTSDMYQKNKDLLDRIKRKNIQKRK